MPHPESTERGVLGLFDSVIMESLDRPGLFDRCDDRSAFYHGRLRRPGRLAVLRVLHVRHRVGLQLPQSRRLPRRRRVLVGSSGDSPDPRVSLGLGAYCLGTAVHGHCTFPAGSSVLRLFSSTLYTKTDLVTILGAVFFFAMVAAVASG